MKTRRSLMLLISFYLSVMSFTGEISQGFANPSLQPSDVKKFRVQIFPHTGVYHTPEGTEPDVTQVTVTTTGTCSASAAAKDANQDWNPQGPVLSAANQFHFTLSQLENGKSGALYFSCTQFFVVQRPAPLKSFSYSGDFVVLTSQNQVQVINVVGPELYLQGVIPNESDATWPAEALKAQAVAARTFAWWTVIDARQAVSDFDLDDTVLFQVYLGNYGRTPASDASADQTKSILLKYNNQIIKAYFYADSGGYTEDASEVFGDDFPYCQAKPEQYNESANASSSNWQMLFKSQDLSQLLVNAKLIPGGVSISQINVGSGDLDRSGRVVTVHLSGSDGKKYEIDGPDFRYATQLKSTLFQLSASGSQYTFNGKGSGHGVGMAQVGAMEYAKQLHWTFDQILKFYYTGVTLTND